MRASDSQMGSFHCPHGLSSGRPPLAWASPVSVCDVFCCSVVRFKNGQGSNLDGGNYHVYENGSLEIKMIRKEDQGIYTCVATNILGKAENQVRLEVKGKGVGWCGEAGVGQGKEAASSKLSTCVILLKCTIPDVQSQVGPSLCVSQGLQSAWVLGTLSHYQPGPNGMRKGNLLPIPAPHRHPRNYIIASQAR